MQTVREKSTFIFSWILYLLFHIRIGSTLWQSMTASLWQIFSTAPYTIGCTIFIVLFLQYMAGGERLPWDRRIRIFLLVGIMGGLLMGIYEYGGSVQQR